ncbi:hypothetical protein BC567DRAFT_213981 [Phyllosticta citribraziliensis]
MNKNPFSRFVHPKAGEIRWKQVKFWVQCGTSVQSLMPLPRGLRLIDVEDKCIIDAPQEPFNYVCLSYVWGEQRKGELLAILENIGKL